MPDLEKVIKGLACRLECGCMNEDHCNPECPYLGDPRACYGLDEDALALMKEQEPVIPKRFGVSWFCGNCKTKLVFTRSNKAAYCWRCGKAVKWSE